MMKIEIYVAEKKIPPFCQEASGEYVKRLGRYGKIKLVQGEKNRGGFLRKPGEYTIVLSAKGKSVSSEDLASMLQELGIQGKSTLRILIGWPESTAGDFYLKLTEGHHSVAMETVLMTEQLYRGFRILKGEPYHK